MLDQNSRTVLNVLISIPSDTFHKCDFLQVFLENECPSLSSRLRSYKAIGICLCFVFGHFRPIFSPLKAFVLMLIIGNQLRCLIYALLKGSHWIILLGLFRSLLARITLPTVKNKRKF